MIRYKDCTYCKGTGYTTKYFDAGDHFSASASPFSGWVKVQCEKCKDKHDREEFFRRLQDSLYKGAK